MDLLHWYVLHVAAGAGTGAGRSSKADRYFHPGFIPFLGDITNVLLNYNLIVKLAKKLDLPESILTKMYMTNAVAAGVG